MIIFELKSSKHFEKEYKLLKITIKHVLFMNKNFIFASH